jgi:DsbC/DsbD-like thiol-disulfide interchange protein
MKRLLVLALVTALLATGTVKAQILKPVTWSYGAKKTGPNEATLYFKATIGEGWHVYSQHVKEGGPVATKITFTPSPGYVLNGPTTEPQPIKRMEQVFNMEVGFFEKSVVFEQKIKLKAGQTTVKGQLEFMTCNDSQCLPPEDIDFSIALK